MALLLLWNFAGFLLVGRDPLARSHAGRKLEKARELHSAGDLLDSDAYELTRGWG